MSMLLPLPFVPQLRDGYCLPACVTMVLTYWGVQINQPRVAQLLGTTDVGTPISRVQRLSNHGLEVKFNPYGEWVDIGAEINAKQPVIVAVHAGWLPYAKIQSSHAIVVVGYADHDLTILDPTTNGEPIELSQDAFMIAWIEMDCSYAVIKPH